MSSEILLRYQNVKEIPILYCTVKQGIEYFHMNMISTAMDVLPFLNK